MFLRTEIQSEDPPFSLKPSLLRRDKSMQKQSLRGDKINDSLENSKIQGNYLKHGDPDKIIRIDLDYEVFKFLRFENMIHEVCLLFYR